MNGALDAAVLVCYFRTMDQAGKYLLRIVALGVLGAIAVSGGCSLQTTHGGSGVIPGTFLLIVGALLAIGAVVVMLVWAAKTIKS